MNDFVLIDQCDIFPDGSQDSVENELRTRGMQIMGTHPVPLAEEAGGGAGTGVQDQKSRGGGMAHAIDVFCKQRRLGALRGGHARTAFSS